MEFINIGVHKSSSSAGTTLQSAAFIPPVVFTIPSVSAVSNVLDVTAVSVSVPVSMSMLQGKCCL